MYPVISSPSKYRTSTRGKKHTVEDSFVCSHCGAVIYTQPVISGVQNRNHCPYCLSSLHVDHAQAGDRLSACRGIMHPVGLTVKPGRNKYRKNLSGELMLIHRCRDCGKLSINRLAADDQVDRLMEIFFSSVNAEMDLLHQLLESDIHILTQDDLWLVECQLTGCERK